MSGPGFTFLVLWVTLGRSSASLSFRSSVQWGHSVTSLCDRQTQCLNRSTCSECTSHPASTGEGLVHAERLVRDTEAGTWESGLKTDGETAVELKVVTWQNERTRDISG